MQQMIMQIQQLQNRCQQMAQELLGMQTIMAQVTAEMQRMAYQTPQALAQATPYASGYLTQPPVGAKRPWQPGTVPVSEVNSTAEHVAAPSTSPAPPVQAATATHSTPLVGSGRQSEHTLYGRIL